MASDLDLHSLPFHSPGFTDNPLYTALFLRHSDKTSAAKNNRYLHLVQTRGLIPLVNDNHVDNLKEILVCVFFGLIINNQPNKTERQCV